MAHAIGRRGIFFFFFDDGPPKTFPKSYHIINRFFYMH